MDVIAKYLDNPEAIPWTLCGLDAYDPPYDSPCDSPYVDAVCWFLSQYGDPVPWSIAQASFYMVAFCVTPTIEYKEFKKVHQYVGGSELERNYREIIKDAIIKDLTHDGSNWTLMGYVGASDPLQKIRDKGELVFSPDAFYWWWRTGGLRRAVGADWLPLVFRSWGEFENRKARRALTEDATEKGEGHYDYLPQEVIDRLRAPDGLPPRLTPTPDATPDATPDGRIIEALTSVVGEADARGIVARLPVWLKKSKDNPDYRPRLLASLMTILTLEKEGVTRFPISESVKISRQDANKNELEAIQKLVTQTVSDAIDATNIETETSGSRDIATASQRTADAIKRTVTAVIIDGKENKERRAERAKQYKEAQERKPIA